MLRISGFGQATFGALALTCLILEPASEGDIEVLSDKLEGVRWDIIGLYNVRRTGENFLELKNGHIFYVLFSAHTFNFNLKR